MNFVYLSPHFPPNYYRFCVGLREEGPRRLVHGLGLEAEETNVRVFPRYTGFDLYLIHQLGLARLSESMLLDDLESHVAHNPELIAAGEEDEEDTDY